MTVLLQPSLTLIDNGHFQWVAFAFSTSKLIAADTTPCFSVSPSSAFSSSRAIRTCLLASPSPSLCVSNRWVYTLLHQLVATSWANASGSAVLRGSPTSCVHKRSLRHSQIGTLRQAWRSHDRDFCRDLRPMATALPGVAWSDHKPHLPLCSWYLRGQGGEFLVCEQCGDQMEEVGICARYGEGEPSDW